MAVKGPLRKPQAIILVNLQQMNSSTHKRLNNSANDLAEFKEHQSQN
jgi:hypothetical protein